MSTSIGAVRPSPWAALRGTGTSVKSRRYEKREDRREMILDVARESFLADGYAATSMSTIAARAGGSKGTLYTYFKSKEDLFSAMMQRQCSALQATLFDVAEANAEPRVQLARLARSFLDLLLTPDGLAIHRLAIAEAGRFPELGRIFYNSGPRVVIGELADYLEDFMERGILRRADPHLVAHHFKDLAISGIHQARLLGVINHPTPQELELQVGRAVDTFLLAYAP